MPDHQSVSLTGVPSLEDLMVACAKQSIFDLPALAKRLVDAAQEQTEGEDAPGDGNALIHQHYVFWHEEV